MKLLRLVSVLLVVAGASLTCRAVYLRAKAELAGMLIRHAWQESVRTGKHCRPWPGADTYPIARLRIPRLGYDEIVLEGANERTLAFGPARLLDGATLDEPGNVVFAGHRTSWFRKLEDIEDGDKIQVDGFDSRRRAASERLYTVSMIRVQDPKEMTLLGPTTEDALTLLTCYPFGRGSRSPQRLLVRAQLVGEGYAMQQGLARIKE
jgi:sortase A